MINSPFPNSPPFFSVYVNIKTVGHYETGGIFYTSPIHTLFLQYGIKKVQNIKDADAKYECRFMQKQT